MELSPEFLLAIIGALLILWLGTLQYIFAMHIKGDDQIHRKHDLRFKVLFNKLDDHDKKQQDFRVEMENRLTRIETKIEDAINGAKK